MNTLSMIAEQKNSFQLQVIDYKSKSIISPSLSLSQHIVMRLFQSLSCETDFLFWWVVMYFWVQCQFSLGTRISIYIISKEIGMASLKLSFPMAYLGMAIRNQRLFAMDQGTKKFSFHDFWCIHITRKWNYLQLYERMLKNLGLTKNGF